MQAGITSSTNTLAAALASVIAQHIARCPHPPVIMISGAQGAGKTTALAQLRAASPHRLAIIGLDDVYLPHAARQKLAANIHPLCATRGPAGTHDLALLVQLLSSLHAGRPTPIPVFDKRSDDRLAQAHWPILEGRPDAIVIEGWMMGALPDATAARSAPLNDLEAQEDTGGAWRGWQEAHLAADYAKLWDMADAFCHIDAPAFDTVLSWRTQQEEATLGLAPGTLPPERRAWVARFVQHFERVTRRMARGQRRSGPVITLDAQRRPTTSST